MLSAAYSCNFTVNQEPATVFRSITNFRSWWSKQIVAPVVLFIFPPGISILPPLPPARQRKSMEQGREGG